MQIDNMYESYKEIHIDHSAINHVNQRFVRNDFNRGENHELDTMIGPNKGSSIKQSFG